MRRLAYELYEAFRIAWAQIRANKMRSILTALGVIIGILAVTLMGTAIMGINGVVENSLAGFGDDILYVTKWPWRDASDDWWVFRNRPPLRPELAVPVNEWIETHPGSLLKRAMPEADWEQVNVVRGEFRVSGIRVESYPAEYPQMRRVDMKEGRFYTDVEVHGARNVVVLGIDVANALFPNESPVGKTVQMRNQQFTVVGVAARMGSFLGIFSMDQLVIMPITTFRRYFPTERSDLSILVQIDQNHKEEAKDELRGVMRRIRKLGPEKKDDFEINSQDVMREFLDPVRRGIAVAGLFVTGLALFVGAIGIMNITYVSVKERTKEIGTRKALGARRRTILLQFLIEAVSICLIGGICGILGSRLLTLVVGQAFPSFPMPFSPVLVGVGLTLSVMTGVLSGYIPALQASKLDPVEALRYE
jgi:putative ABC transport system permease protein